MPQKTDEHLLLFTLLAFLLCHQKDEKNYNAKMRTSVAVHANCQPFEPKAYTFMKAAETLEQEHGETIAIRDFLIIKKNLKEMDS